jgi:hypothetical protein
MIEPIALASLFAAGLMRWVSRRSAADIPPPDGNVISLFETKAQRKRRRTG